MSEKNEQFPNGLEAFFLWIALVGLEYVIGAALHDMHLGLSPYELGAIDTVLSCGVLFSIVMHVKGLSYASLFHGAAAKPTTVTLLLLAPIVLLLPALMMAESLLSEIVVQAFPLSRREEAMFAAMDGRNLGVFVAVCVLAPVLEEMLFRGIILRSFLRQYPRWTAIIGSATLFGFAHMNLYQFIGATIFGVFAGWMYERSQSLIPSITMHFINNTALTMLSWNVFPGAERLQALPGLTMCGVLLLAAGGAGLLYCLLPSLAVPAEK